MAVQLRKNHPKVYGGYEKLAYFYDVLAPEHREVEAEVLETHLNRLQAWVAIKPKSVAARIALASLYGSYAWLARGGGYAKDVTEQGWKDFQTYTRKKHQLLVDATQSNVADPSLFALLCLSARDVGLLRDEATKYFEAGVAIDRDYDDLYVSYANWLLPQWGAKKGELKAFAERAATMVSKSRADLIYAKIAWVGKWSNPYIFVDDWSFSWERMRNGIAVMLREYPESSMLNHFAAWAACAQGDRVFAKNLFSKLAYGLDGDSEEIWGTKPKYFESCRSWAIGAAPTASMKAVSEGTWCAAPSFVAQLTTAANKCLSENKFERLEWPRSIGFRPSYEGKVAVTMQPKMDLILSRCLVSQIKVDPSITARRWCQVAVVVTPPQN